MKPGGDLAKEIGELGDYTVRSISDARAICRALRGLPARPTDEGSGTSSLFALTGLFQDVEGKDAPAFDVLYKQGLPELIRIYREKVKHLNDDDADDLLFVLKILAMYGSREGAETVVDAARRPLKPDDYLWNIILSQFSEGHPHRDYVFKALSDPLPRDFIAVSLADSANAAARKEKLDWHPFDSQAGWKQLQNWLEDRDPDHFNFAHSATAALPFIKDPPRDQLLALAMNHLDPGVQIEAAWAAASLGREAGLKLLSRFCLDVNQSVAARSYLAELGRFDLVPPETSEPSFLAKADFAGWLSHPNELSQPPDELEIVDHRQLRWPPDRETKPFWLIRYRLRDKTGLEDDDVDCGLVGSMTWCFFSYKMHQRPPEDAYAIHCFWEMRNAELIEEEEEDEAAKYADMLKQWKGPALEEPKLLDVATISPELNYPSNRVALVSAKVEGQEGWAVLDGPASAWYPKDEQPQDTFDSVVLMIHVGRQLLGFRGPVDRKKFLVSEHAARSPEQIIAAYEKLLAEAAQSEPERQAELMGSFSALSKHFDAYIDALIARGRAAEVAALIERFATHLDDGTLGAAAFRAGERNLAERYLTKLREESTDYHRNEEMSTLAEIWHGRGEAERARELLLDCMRRLLGEINDAEYESDREMFAGELAHHRTTYLRLFPDGTADLEKKATHY